MKNNSKRKRVNNDFVMLREDVVVNRFNIDCVIKTKNSPKDNSTLKDYVYVVYLKNSKYNWIQLTEKEYNNYLKKYL